MRVASERIVLPEGCSWGLFHNDLDTYRFRWHSHREYELTLTLNARGRRYVGDHIDGLDACDLVLVGPHLPHSWSAEPRDPERGPIRTIVLWFPPEWVERLTGGFAEFVDLGSLFAQSERGLLFSPETATTTAERIEALPALPPRQRFAAMLALLDRLAADAPRQLASPAYGGRVGASRGERRLDSVLTYIHEHYHQPITAEATARRFGMSPSTFFRFFRRHMRQNFSDYLTGLRIGRACALLLETDAPVYVVAEQAGYHNVSHFHRQFRERKQRSPADFRRRFEGDHALPGGERPSGDHLAVPVSE